MVRKMVWVAVLGMLGLLVRGIETANVAMARESRRMGEETIGNRPLSEANFKQWPGIMPVVNHSTRVYHSWVNGNEHTYYKTTTAELNELIRNYAAMALEGSEIVVLPGPGKVTNFAGDQQFTYHCQLHIVSGIASVMHRRQNGDVFWPKTPRLTLRIDESIELESLEFPEGCRVVLGDELKRRFVGSLDSVDQEVRGWGLSHLAELDPYDPQLMEVVAERLRDPEPWVAGCALRVLPKFGPPAVKFLGELGPGASSNDLTEDRKLANEESAKLATDEARQSYDRSRDEHVRWADRIRKVLQTEPADGSRQQ
jgi:hypothetical protein